MQRIRENSGKILIAGSSIALLLLGMYLEIFF